VESPSQVLFQILFKFLFSIFFFLLATLCFTYIQKRQGGSFEQGHKIKGLAIATKLAIVFHELLNAARGLLAHHLGQCSVNGNR